MKSYASKPKMAKAPKARPAGKNGMSRLATKRAPKRVSGNVR